MKIIPVVDYKQGKVVLAVKGQRDAYMPITQGLFTAPTLSCAIDTFIQFADCVYIADLDSIVEKNIDRALWANIFLAYPNTQFWLDIGSEVQQWSTFMQSASNVRPVVGSESFSTIDELCTILEKLAEFQPLLSIDMSGEDLLGPTNLISSIASWPKDLIYLQLKRVGSAAGPDISWLESNVDRLKDFNLHVGGGIRNIQDIKQLENKNVAGVLIANALHNGDIDAEQIKAKAML